MKKKEQEKNFQNISREMFLEILSLNEDMNSVLPPALKRETTSHRYYFLENDIEFNLFRSKKEEFAVYSIATISNMKLYAHLVYSFVSDRKAAGKLLKKASDLLIEVENLVNADNCV